MKNTLPTGPAVHEWTGPYGDKFRDVRSPYGTYYRDSTPPAVASALDRAMRERARVRFWYGDTETGEPWLEENEVDGYVGRSTGTIPIALIVNLRSHGGPGILTHCIVRLDLDGRTVYQHPGFTLPKIEVRFENLYGESPWAAFVNDEPDPHARFRTERSANRWRDFMLGRRAAK